MSNFQEPDRPSDVSQLPLVKEPSVDETLDVDRTSEKLLPDQQIMEKAIDHEDITYEQQLDMGPADEEIKKNNGDEDHNSIEMQQQK